MNEMLRRRPTLRTPGIELNIDEKAQLNAIIDQLIPSDENFPAPSSLQLIDEFLFHLSPGTENYAPRMLDVKRLRTVLHDLNISAGGNFCQTCSEKQQELLRRLEQRDPAFFQELWTLANHSYYTHIAIRVSVASTAHILPSTLLS